MPEIIEKSEPTAASNHRQRHHRNEEKIQFVHNFKGCAIVVELKLISTDLQYIFRRHFDGVSRAVFYLRFYTGKSYDIEITEKVFQEVDHKFNEVRDFIHTRYEVADRLVAEAGIKAQQKKISGNKYNVPIIDPYANDFLSLLEQGDDLVTKLTQLWLARILDNSNYNKANKELMRELRNLHNTLHKLGIGLRNRLHPDTESNPVTKVEVKENTAAEGDRADDRTQVAA